MGQDNSGGDCVDDFSRQVWHILERYWIIPPPERFERYDLEGLCIVCGIWVSRTDPEGSGCPRRYLIPHAEILPFVVSELRLIHGHEGWLSTSDIRLAGIRGLTKWRETQKA